MDSVRYVSTRGEAPQLGFAEAMLAGLARDGGLYVPQSYPTLSRETIAGFSGRPYADVAEAVIAPFGLDRADLSAALADAYSAFRHVCVTPVSQIGDNLFLLDLAQGPTLAFKDVAMQLLGRLMDAELGRQGKRATIVGATSGDTGAAAMEAFKGLSHVDVFILFPDGRVSDVQRRQMTTLDDPNVHALALDGSFDDCQAILKRMFLNAPFRDAVGLSGVNSINWARIVAQIVYYFAGAVAVGGPQRAVSFAVPTGNFGDILAGWIAKRMGLPIQRLSIATNANDILARALANGAYETRGVTATQSPSMDIQVSSNFERLLFEALGRDAAGVRASMASLAQSGRFEIPGPVLAAIRAEFDAATLDEAGTTAEIARVYRETGTIIDPHTACGVAAARALLAADPATPTLALATAHPAKFPDAVRAAIGRVAPLPDHLGTLMEAPERMMRLPNDQAKVEAFVRAHARVTRGAAA
jgi:threonine synthase